MQFILSPGSAHRRVITRRSSSILRFLYCEKWVVSCAFWAISLGIKSSIYWSLFRFSERSCSTWLGHYLLGRAGGSSSCHGSFLAHQPTGAVSRWGFLSRRFSSPGWTSGPVVESDDMFADNFKWSLRRHFQQLVYGGWSYGAALCFCSD